MKGQVKKNNEFQILLFDGHCGKEAEFNFCLKNVAEICLNHFQKQENN